MPQIDSKIFEKLLFVVFTASSVQFPTDFVISSNTNENGRKNYALQYLEKMMQRLLQNSSE